MMRYKVFFDEHMCMVGDTPIYGAGPPLGETDDRDEAMQIAVESAIACHNGVVVTDNEEQELWWFNEEGAEQ